MTVALALLAGVLLGLLSAGIPGILWQAAAGGLLIAWALSSWRHHRWFGACALFMAGQLLAFAHAEHWRVRSLPAGETDGARLLAVGVVEDVPARDGSTLRFGLRTESLAGAVSPDTPRLLRIRWRDPHATPRVGERWRLLLRVTALEETCNFDGPDMVRQAFRAGIHGSGRVLPSAMNGLLALAPASLDTLRARIALRVGDRIADPDAAALVTALAVGLTAGMSRDQWRVFNATGTTHLVAISGLHVTLFAWLVFRGARLMWRRLPGAQVVAREPFALLLGLAAAGAYSLLAGLSVPTQRTWLMLALYVCARLAARRVDAGRLWAMAMVGVLVTDARAPLAAGFWLSFIAVGVLLAFAGEEWGVGGTQRRSGPVAHGWSVVRVQLTIMLALLPVTLAIFGGVSLTGLAVNLVAIPVISLVFVPVVLAGALTAWWIPAWDAPFFALAAHLYDLLWPMLAWCAEPADHAGLLRVAPSGWWFLMALPASLAWLFRWPWPLRLTASCALLPLAFAPTQGPDPADARVRVLDAGRGTVVLVTTRTHALLFDTGDAWNTHGTRLAEIVLPAIEASRIRRVDVLVLPTLDADRARAAALLAVERELGGVIVGGGWPASGLPASACRDSRWQWDGVQFLTYAVGGRCVLKVATGTTSVLVPGDLDTAGERALVARVGGADLASDVVIIGRQASELASSRQWIETTAPGLAIATGGIEGAQSRRRVADRWRRRSVVLDTRTDGAIDLQLGPRGWEVRASARASRFPFHWRRPV
ncbi:MAG TPA: DNA internalization-related competence protein ComEC/Rec2 [Steroidobacteraceae bacterium]|nr:DNA internalization-related competence protein ComEC/Rec2 [Steroidobacteraceae bacterium]